MKGEICMMGFLPMAILRFGGNHSVSNMGLGHGFMGKLLFIELLGRLGLHGVYAVLGYFVILFIL